MAGARRATVAAVAVVVVLGFGVAVGAAMEDDQSGTSSAGTGTGAATAPSAVDIGFSQDMIVHHEQAVLMAQLVRGRTQDPRIAALAAGIEDDQLLDIGAMRGYLTLWQAPILPPGPPMSWMADADHHAGMPTMPGMASTAEINALRKATGAAMDAMFLRLMLRHHEGGQAMLADAAAHANLEAVRALASRIAFHQQEESRTISTLLAARTSS
jgi:uncharacterized protein (DUF305 family)